MGSGSAKRISTKPKIWALRRIVLSLLLGGVLTVAVAWGVALLTDQRYEYTRGRSWTSFTNGPYFESERPAAFPEMTLLHRMHLFGASHLWAIERADTLELIVHPTSNEKVEVLFSSSWNMERHEYGMPWRAMVAFEDPWTQSQPRWMSRKMPEQSVFHFSHFSLGLEVPGWVLNGQSDRELNLPLRPIWPGFLYSTLLYSAFCWMLLFLVGTARLGLRRRRCQRRGLCISCKYPVTGFSICPECGFKHGDCE